MTVLRLCDALQQTRVFSHYAYGDPLPCYAMYFSSDGKTVPFADAEVVYVRCTREHGHAGVHLAPRTKPWTDQ